MQLAYNELQYMIHYIKGSQHLRSSICDCKHVLNSAFYLFLQSTIKWHIIFLLPIVAWLRLSLLSIYQWSKRQQFCCNMNIIWCCTFHQKFVKTGTKLTISEFKIHTFLWGLSGSKATVRYFLAFTINGFVISELHCDHSWLPQL